MKILLSFDDACVEDLYIAELLGKNKLNGIFYFPVYPERCNEVKGRQSLTLSEQKEIAARFEIGSHTLNHPLLTRIKKDIAWVEIANSKTMLMDRFKQPINSFCYPRGYANPELQMMVKDAGYTTARSTIVGYIHQSENPYFIQTAVHVAPRKEYAGLSWLEYARKLLFTAERTKNSVFHVFAHGWEIEKYSLWDEFERFLGELSETAHS